MSGLVKSQGRVVKLQRVDPTYSSDDSSAAVAKVMAEEVHAIELLGAVYEMFVPTYERRWSTTLTELTEVPRTLDALRVAGAADGDVYLGLLQVVR